jgi:methionyl-tRNA formyltransferase
MRLVFAGTPEVAVPALEALLASEHEVVAVVTRPDAPSGRGRRLVRSVVGQRADDLGLPVLTPTKPRDPEFIEALSALAPDCCPVVAYGALLPRPVLDIPRLGWVNLHFSLLPAWRGAAPVQHAIWHGDDLTGATTFLLDEGMDTGPVLGTVVEPIRPTDTSGDLLARLADSGAELLVRSIDALADGSAAPVAQSDDGATLAPRIEVADARIDWTQPAIRVDRQVRACTPAPGAWTTLREDRVGIGPVLADPDADPLPAGAIRAGRREVWIGTATHPVRLGEVRPQGRKPMPAADWARGLRLADGESLA